jgi:hypothetical protein
VAQAQPRQELGSGLTDDWLNFIAPLPVTDRTQSNVNLVIGLPPRDSF